MNPGASANPAALRGIRANLPFLFVLPDPFEEENLDTLQPTENLDG